MTDYSKGNIYELVSGGTDKIYIGSTTQKLYNMLAVHKCMATCEHKRCSSRFLFEHVNVNIILLEDYPSERKEQLLARERHWIETLPDISYHMPGRTPKESRAVKSVCDICRLGIGQSALRRHRSRNSQL